MSGKRAAPKSTKGDASVSQPSILSFFGKGSSSAALPREAANKKNNGGPKPRKSKEDTAAVAAGSATSSPAAKRRKKGSTAATTVDLTAATTSEAGGSASSSPSAEEGTTTAAAATPRGRPARTTAPDRRWGRKGSSRAAVASTSRPTAVAEKAIVDRSLGLAAGGDGGPGGESESESESEPDDVPSPKTDSEKSSPSAALSSKKRAEKKQPAAVAVVAAAAAGRGARKRSRPATLATTSERKMEADNEVGSGGSVVVVEGRREEEEEEDPGRRRNDGHPGGEKREATGPLPGGGGGGGEARGQEGGIVSDDTGGVMRGRHGGPVIEGTDGEARGHEGGSVIDETDGDDGESPAEEGSDYASGGGRRRSKDEGIQRRGEEDVEAERQDVAEKEERRQTDGEISQYELQRLERIKRNQAFMATLGLSTAKPPAPSSSAAAAAAGGGGAKGGRSKKRSRPVSRAKEKAPAVPVRRSARARGAEAVDYNEDKQAASAIATTAARAAPEPEPVLEEIDFDDSTVLKYLCGGGEEGKASDGDVDGPAACATPAAAAAGTAPAEGAKVVGLRVLEPGHPLAASGLSTIYTMHFGGGGAGAPPLLAAGGKGGIVALFSTRRQQQGRSRKCDGDGEEEDEEEDERTLMNFKAHKGWVSAVRFLEGGGSGGACRLLSSANDSVVKLWDTSKQHRGLPRLLSTIDDLHPTRKGIFAMDSYGSRVVTGSKDSTVSIACLRPTGLECDRVLGDPGGSQAFHEKVVKGVSLRDENTVASCGDDSSVRVSDLRSTSPLGVSRRLDGVHGGRPCHTVRWHPFDANLLLTAGLDSTVKLHDLRRPDAPLHVFRGHCPYALARPRSIHRPEFFFPAAGAAGKVNILSCGERSEKLSMYDAGTGATVSRGLLGAEASALAVGGGGWSRPFSSSGAVAAALPGGSVVLLEPVSGSD